MQVHLLFDFDSTINGKKKKNVLRFVCEQLGEEMAEAAVGFLLENLKQILLHHGGLIKDVKKEVESIENDLRLFSGFLKDCTQHSRQSQAMTQLIREIRTIVLDIEDVIEAYVAEAADSRSRGYFTRLFDSTPRKLLSVAKDVKGISDRVKRTLDTSRIELAFRGFDTQAEAAAAAAAASLQSKVTFTIILILAIFPHILCQKLIFEFMIFCFLIEKMVHW